MQPTLHVLGRCLLFARPPVLSAVHRAIKQKLQHLFHQAAVLRAAGVMVICLRREDGLRVRYREGSLNMLLISAI